jgi:hypothetical protein
MANVLRWVARVIGAALLGTTAGIHAYLYTNGYGPIPTIGALFLLTAVSASVLAVLLVVVPQRFVGLVALAGAGLEFGTVMGLALAVNHSGGIFNFQDSTRAPLVWPSVWVEITGTLVLGLLVLDSAGQVIRSRGHGRVSVSHA